MLGISLMPGIGSPLAIISTMRWKLAGQGAWGGELGAAGSE